jgi:predicted transposase YdaD
MKWKDIRQAFPEQWVLIEAIQAHTDNKSERVLDEIALLKRFSESPDAMKAYQEIHLEEPKRELYVLHTSRKEPNIIEKKWVGVRR